MDGNGGVHLFAVHATISLVDDPITFRIALATAIPPIVRYYSLGSFLLASKALISQSAECRHHHNKEDYVRLPLDVLSTATTCDW